MPVLTFAGRAVFTAALAPCPWLTEDNGDQNGAALSGEGGARGAGTRRAGEDREKNVPENTRGGRALNGTGIIPGTG